jgi:hypothetical protein
MHREIETGRLTAEKVQGINAVDKVDARDVPAALFHPRLQVPADETTVPGQKNSHRPPLHEHVHIWNV